MPKESKLKKIVTRDFIQWALKELNEKYRTDTEEVEEHLWALKILCEKADMSNVFQEMKEKLKWQNN